MFKKMYGREPVATELSQFKSYYKFKTKEKELYGAAKKSKESKLKNLKNNG